MNKPWTSTEVEYLIDNCSEMTKHNIAATLNRSYESVKSKMKELGLTGGERKVWLPEEISLLTKLREENISLEEISNKVGHSIKSVKTKLCRMGI